MKQIFSDISDSLKTAYSLDRTALLMTVLTTVINSVNPYIGILLSAYIVDGLVSGTALMHLITATAIGLSLIFVLRIIEGVANKVKEVHIESCVRKFNMEMTKITLSMDYELLDSPKVNEIRNRMRNDRSWGAGFYSVFWQLSWLLESLFSLFAALIIIFPLFATGDFLTSWVTPVFLFSLFVIMISAALFDSKYISKKKYALMDEASKMRSLLGYFVFGGGLGYKAGKDVRIFGAKALIKKYNDDSHDWNVTWKRRFTIFEGAGGLVSGISSGILQGCAYLFVVLRAAAGALTVGSVLKYAAVIFNFANSLSSFMNAVSQFAVTAKRQRSSLEYCSVPNVLYKGTLPVEKRNDNEYEIEFHNVSFKYPSSDDYVLRNISLKLKIGERLAVVGMNGSGKTTLIKLLCRLYDPSEGQITLNGIDVKKYDYNEYLSIFSVVFQDFRLFSLTLGQNIAANVDYEIGRVEEALDKVGFGDRYRSMQRGAETYIYKDFEEGVEISGGEAQKIALARALYKDAPFIILDEPTAALDPIAEYEIYTKFNNIVGSKTAIYISHRLSSCRFCDDIAVFHEGRLIQRGSHDILLENRDGKYYELWNAQAQYYAENPM